MQQRGGLLWGLLGVEVCWSDGSSVLGSVSGWIIVTIVSWFPYGLGELCFCGVQIFALRTKVTVRREVEGQWFSIQQRTLYRAGLCIAVWTLSLCPSPSACLPALCFSKERGGQRKTVSRSIPLGSLILISNPVVDTSVSAVRSCLFVQWWCGTKGSPGVAVPLSATRRAERSSAYSDWTTLLQTGPSDSGKLRPQCPGRGGKKDTWFLTFIQIKMFKKQSLPTAWRCHCPASQFAFSIFILAACFLTFSLI